MPSDNSAVTVFPIAFSSSTSYFTTFGGQAETNTSTDSSWNMIIKTSTKTSSQFQAVGLFRGLYWTTVSWCIAIGY